MKHDFEERKERRIENARKRAAKAEAESDARYKAAKSIGDMIPFGQPILVGHHSEKRHRRDIEKIDNNMRQSVALQDKAKYYEGKAESIENNDAIFSDDPNALDKLRDKLQNMEKIHELMKATNKAIKKFKSDPDKQIEALKELGHPEKNIINLLSPDYCNRTGYPSYKLTNNNANMKTVKQRIAKLERLSVLENQEWDLTDEIKMVQNVDANRLQIKFPGKPADHIRKELKSQGFRWAPSEEAWQRHLNTNTKWYLNHFKKYLNPQTETVS